MKVSRLLPALLLTLSAALSSQAAAPSLTPVLSTEVSTSDTNPASTVPFLASDGHRYLIRVTGASAPVGLSAYEDGNGQPIATSTGSNLNGEPAVLFPVAKGGKVTVTATALVNKRGNATIEIFDATALSSPLIYVEPPAALTATIGAPEGAVLLWHRIGELKKAATYPLTVEIGGRVRHDALRFGAGEDIASVTLTFPPGTVPSGAHEGTIRLDPKGMPSETVANGVLLGLPQEAGITLLDAPAPRKLLTLPLASGRAASGSAKSGQIDFDISLSSPAATPVSLSYVTSDDKAIGGRDYVRTSGRLVFAPGEISKRISVPLLKSETTAGEKTFQLDLLSPFGLTFASGKTADKLNATIRND